MKYQVGDEILVLHSNEEGHIIEIMNNEMVMIEVRGVKFPAYMDQIDFPYFKMFTNNHDPYEKELHNIYKRELCFSPMPSLAIHITNINSVYGISPLLDYFKLWKETNYK
mgnify:CR=1 FL=1